MFPTLVYPLDSRLGGTQSKSGHRCWRKNPLSLLGIKPPLVQSVVRHYNDLATPAHSDTTEHIMSQNNNTMFTVYKTLIRPVLAYDTEAWTIRRQMNED
jgi:hypothetical protein